VFVNLNGAARLAEQFAQLTPRGGCRRRRARRRWPGASA